MNENDFYVAMQDIMTKAFESGWTTLAIIQATENSLDEWYTEVIGDEDGED